jgi:hypothetical protein
MIVSVPPISVLSVELAAHTPFIDWALRYLLRFSQSGRPVLTQDENFLRALHSSSLCAQARRGCKKQHHATTKSVRQPIAQILKVSNP